MTLSDVELARSLAVKAGEILVALRSSLTSDNGREVGADGDRRSNDYLLAELAAQRPLDSVLSEESADNLSRLDAERVWIIDPLDGTREYGMQGRSDWAVHVALWTRSPNSTAAPGSITAAAVSLPALDRVHTTADARLLARCAEVPRVVISASRPQPLAEYVATTIGGVLVPMGSAGAKTMAVLNGEADAYVHSGGQWAWDNAAPVAVAEANGYIARRVDGSAMKYNQRDNWVPDLLVCHPSLLASVQAAIDRYATL